MTEWNIASRAHACQGCGRAFRDQDVLHTLLFSERGGLERQDVCQTCWNEQYAQGANHRKGFVSHWEGSFLVPPPLAPEPIHRETAETLLRKLVERNQALHAGASFILAVMLERKRLLKVKDQTVTEGQRVLIYEHTRSGEVFTIPDPGLRLDQLEAVERDVAQLLRHGLDPVPESLPAGEPAAVLPTATDVPPAAEPPADPPPPPA